MRVAHDLACWVFFTVMLAAVAIIAAVWAAIDIVLEPRARE